MRADPAHTISSETTTTDQLSKLDQLQFGRERRDALDHLGQWCQDRHLHQSEEKLLGQIIRRSRSTAPWTWEDRRGMTAMSAYFGMTSPAPVAEGGDAVDRERCSHRREDLSFAPDLHRERHR